MNQSNILMGIGFECRVSSTLNRNAKLFGKKYLFDGDESTCWNSDQGKPQWIIIQCDSDIQFSSMEIQFQGGFVGVDCTLETWSDDTNSETESFYPEDTYQTQSFKLTKTKFCKGIKITFNDSTDTFGRIIIYKLAFVL